MFAHNSCVRHLLSAALLSGFTLCAPLFASASTPSHYINLRQKSHCDRNLTLTTVQTNPANYAGQAFELRGEVNGKADTGSGVTVIVTLADHTAPVLDVPLSEADMLRDAFTPRLRFLVQVGEGGSGNVVPLKVLAVANDSEVDTLDRLAAQHAEYRAHQEALARQAREREHQYFERSMPRSYHQSIASRGGYYRSPQSIAGDALTQAAYYQAMLNARVRGLFVPYFNFIAGQNYRLDSAMVGQITFNLLKFAESNNVDPRLVVAMIIAESEFDPLSTSHSGAMGLGQLMPETARDLGLNNPYDITQNLAGSVAYLKGRLDDFASKAAPDGGMTLEQIRLAMAAYNAGPNAVKKYNGIPPYRETQAYVNHVERLYRRLCGQ